MVDFGIELQWRMIVFRQGEKKAAKEFLLDVGSVRSDVM